MTCLFGCICNQPEQIAQSLEPVRPVLVAEAPVARWGLGYIQGGEVLLSRNPRLQTDNVDFYSAIAGLQADYIIAHACAPDGLSGNVNTQPFRLRTWMFAQESREERGAPVDAKIEDTSALQAALLEDVPGFIRRNIQGKTLAEHVFHRFLASSYRHGILDEVNLHPGRASQALIDALRSTEDILMSAGAARGLGNLLVSNGRLFVAARLDKPLYMRRLMVPGPRPSHRDVELRGVLVVSSTASPGEGFEEIPTRSALLVSREVRTDIVPLRV